MQNDYLRQADKVRQNGGVVDVEVPLQLVLDGMAQQLHAVVGRLCVALTALGSLTLLLALLLSGACAASPACHHISHIAERLQTLLAMYVAQRW